MAIKRVSLLSRLETTRPACVGLVQAPAGYGKTSLLIDLANESGSAICWVSLDAWDRDPMVFLGYLGASVRRALGLDSQAEDGEAAKEPRERLAELAGMIAGHDGDVDLILDDLHELDEAEATLQLIDYLALRLPPNCRLFLASRTEPRLASWARLDAGGRVTSLVADDLLMTSDEVRELWAAAGNKVIDETFIARLTELSKGWPVALAVATRSGYVQVGDLETQLSDFLTAEIISKLPPDLRDLLEKSSALDIMTAERCQEMPGVESSALEIEGILTELGTMNIPATVVSARPLEVRIHPLVRDLLQSQVRSADATSFKLAHVKAAELDLKDGRISESLAHLATAEAWVELADAIALAAPAAYQAGRWHSIATWLGLLPAEELRGNAELSVWQVRILVRVGKCDQALSTIQEATPSGREIRRDVRATLETLRSAALRTKGEIGAAIRAGEEAKTLAFATNAPVEVVAEARKELGLSLISQGAFEDGIEELSAALEIQQFRGDASDIAFLSGCLGSAYGSVGRLGESVAYLEVARQSFSSLRNSKELSWVLNNLGVAYWFLGNVEKARNVLGECLATARGGGHVRASGFALTSLADIDRLVGDVEIGRDRYNTVLTIAEEVNDVTLGTLALIGLADLERRDGRPDAAEALAKRSIASAETRLARSEEALARLTLARLARQGGNADRALSESAAALAELESEGVARDLGEALLCRAEVLLDLRSHRAELTSTLRRLDEVISKLGQGRFVLYSDRALDILRYAVSRRVGDSYRELLRKLEPAAAESDSSYPPIEVKALGGFEVKMGGRQVEAIEWESEKSRELFLLLLTFARPMTRDEIIAALWPDGERKKSTSAFHSTLHRTRRALYPKVVVESGGWYGLQPEASFSSDVGDFAESSAAIASSDAESTVASLTNAVNAYGGSFVPNLFSDWAEQTRRNLQDQYLTACLRLGQFYAGRREDQASRALFERVLDIDNLNEDAWHGLIVADAGLGGRARAIRSYQRYEQLLKTELGEVPTGRIAGLYRRLRDQRKTAS